MKSIYLTRRKPSFTHDQFVIRWRRHGALAMSKDFFANITTYVQAEILQPSPVAGGTQDFDAIAYIVTQDHVPTQHEYDELRQMEEDEHETFEGIILPRLIVVDEKVVRAGPAGGATAFLFYRNAGEAERIADRYRDSGAGRVVLNLRRHDPGTGEMSALIPYEAVVEISAGTPEALAQTLGPSADAAWRRADLVSITRECVMWERPAAGHQAVEPAK